MNRSRRRRDAGEEQEEFQHSSSGVETKISGRVAMMMMIMMMAMMIGMMMV